MQSIDQKPNSRSKLDHDVLVFMDDSSWIWEFTKLALDNLQLKRAKVASNILLRHSWNRFHNSPVMIIHWEGKHRTGGAIIEEILDIAPSFDVRDRIVVITTNPVHEDVVHFAELGIKRVVRPRLRERDLMQAAEEVIQNIQQMTAPNRNFPKDDVWAKLASAIEQAPQNPQESFVEKMWTAVKKLQDAAEKPSLKEIEVIASLHIKTGMLKEAENLLVNSLENNPNHFRAWNQLIDIKRRLGDHPAAYALLQKTHQQNRGSVRRLAAMGEVQLAMNDLVKAEPFFRSALDRDPWCSNALNGLAEVAFARNDLEETRQLLAKSNLSYRFAVKLNRHGIKLAREGRYAEALEHYSKAQYVLPQQEKSPRLFYNIALCYAKWGRPALAIDFLELALIKEPNYKKAKLTLDKLKINNHLDTLDDLDAA